MTPNTCRECGEKFRFDLDQGYSPDLCSAECLIAELGEEKTKWAVQLQTQIDAWKAQAEESRVEAERIRKTMYGPTEAEERCRVRIEMFKRCAADLDKILKGLVG